MKQKPSSRRRRSSTKSVLRLPDLEHAKAAQLAMKRCKTFRPPGGNLRLRPSRIDEQRRSTAQSHCAEQKSQKTANSAGKVHAGFRHTHLLGQDSQDTPD
jgi:hypothetical protein